MKPLEIFTRLGGTLSRFRPAAQSWVLLGLRLSIGWSFFQTGLGKLRHLENTADYFSSLGIPAPAFHAVFVGGVELLGGVLLMAGFLVPFAAAPLAISMIVALATAHRQELAEGISGLVGAAPFPYLIASLALLVFGGGALAIDAFLVRRAGAMIAVLILALPNPTLACGLTPPIGPNGLPALCHGEESGWRYRAGFTFGGTDTRIRFEGLEGDLLQAASLATLDVMPMERLSLSLSGGASVGGRFEYGGRRFDLAPGPIGGVGVSYLLLGKNLPFLHLSLATSLSQATATAPDGSTSSFTSKDWRLGAAFGKTLGTVAAPFLVARYFGGGTDWSAVGKGADIHRYHAGVGSAFGVTGHVDILVESAILGERRATAGIGYLF